MARQKILMPYNFTASDSKVLDFLVKNFSHREDVSITLFNAYTPLPEIDVKGNPELKKMTGGMTGGKRYGRFPRPGPKSIPLSSSDKPPF